MGQHLYRSDILSQTPLFIQKKKKKKKKLKFYFAVYFISLSSEIVMFKAINQKGESELLLVTRSNDNHSPGPVIREVSP